MRDPEPYEGPAKCRGCGEMIDRDQPCPYCEPREDAARRSFVVELPDLPDGSKSFLLTDAGAFAKFAPDPLNPPRKP